MAHADGVIAGGVSHDTGVRSDDLYRELWACAGPLMDVPRIGKRVYYFPQGHLEGLTALHASFEEIPDCINRINPGKADVSANNSEGENRLLKSQEATSLGNKANEVSLLQSNRPMSSCSKKAKYTVICECFFMTARVLNLGLLLKAFSDFKNLVQVVHSLVWQ